MANSAQAKAAALDPATIEKVRTLGDLAAVLRQLRRAEARRQGASALTYRELAARTGWSHAVIGEYFSGRTLAPTDRFDVLVRLLGATPAEQGALATARDRVEDHRRGGAREGGPAAEGRPVPHELPADVRGFSGRAGLLADLDKLLTDGDRLASTVVIAALSGTAGVGKTALAVHWAHQVMDRFPDGQLYANLRGYDPSGPAMPATDVVRGFLTALGIPPQRIPADAEAQVRLYRSLLADRRVLIVLDNARDADQVRPLLPGSPGCLVLVTSRDQLAGLVAADGAHPLTVDLLTETDARLLLARRLGASRVSAEPHAVRDIIARCAGLPLALAIVAARAAARRRFPLEAIAGELRGAGDLDAFAGDDPLADLRAAFSLSYRALTDGAAGVFRILGQHLGGDIATPTVASMAGTPVARIRPLLSELTRAHLLTEHLAGRFAFHDLLRTYAAELALTHDPQDHRRSALRRVLDHYLHTASAASTLLDPHWALVPLPPPATGVTPVRLDTPGQALTWLVAEREALVTAVARAESTGFDDHAWRLAAALAVFLERQGHWDDSAATHRVALRAARRTGDRSWQAQAHRWLGLAYVRLGRHDEAHAQLRRALDLFAKLGDHAGSAYTHRAVSWVYEVQGRHREALRHTEEALALHRATGNRAGLARALNAIGWYHAELGDFQAAQSCCEQALDRLEELGDRHGQADASDSLGLIHSRLGDHDRALECYQRALDLYRETGDRAFEASALADMGDTQRAAGDVEGARDSWRCALTIFEELGHPDARKIRAKLGPAGYAHAGH